MKLLSLHVEGFGRLSELDMRFDGGLNCLHRKNGWGKSTLAVFIKAMLYGLPATSKRSRHSGISSARLASVFTFSESFLATLSTKVSFLAVESSAVMVRSGRAIARGRVGKPPPQPTSITSASMGILSATVKESITWRMIASRGSVMAVRFIDSFTEKRSERSIAKASALSA